MRHMAFGVVGPTVASGDTSARLAPWYRPTGSRIIPHVPFNVRPVPFALELDDTAIFVSCNLESDHWLDSVLKFHSYTDFISPQARSIGVLTLPESTGAITNTTNSPVQPLCQVIAQALLDSIATTHPQARVTIRSDDTLAVTYARLVLANTSIGGLSTLSVLPIMSTLGTAVWHEPRVLSVRNVWITTAPRMDELSPNVHLIEDGYEFMQVQHLRQLYETQGQAAVLAWFQRPTNASYMARAVLPVQKVIAWQGVAAIEDLFRSTFTIPDTFFCELIHAERAKNVYAVPKPTLPVLPILLDVSFGCRDLFDLAQDHGSGGFLRLLYSLRLGAMVHLNIGVNFTCHDAESTKHDLVIPWFTGYYPPRANGAVNHWPVETIDLASAPLGCGPYDANHIAKLYREIQFDFRRMAIGLVGIPNDAHASATFAKSHLTFTPLHNSNKSNHGEWSDTAARQVPVDPATIAPVYAQGAIDLDDAVIHFRCGDLMDSDHKFYGFLKFKSYTRFISPQARSIGILTQPYPDANGTIGQTRHVDTASNKVHERCRIVTLAFVEHIQSTHPQARVTVRNGPAEDIALTYARIVMANQSIGGISTFSVLPILSTFGTGYWHEPLALSSGNAWVLTPRFDELASNVHIIENGHEVMVVKDMRQLWETDGANAVVAWFQS